jgi:hypothetical protein
MYCLPLTAKLTAAETMRPPGVEGPQFLPGAGIKGEDVALQVAAKDQVARGREERHML